jgi:hypothetical protein
VHHQQTQQLYPGIAGAPDNTCAQHGSVPVLKVGLFIFLADFFCDGIILVSW